MEALDERKCIEILKKCAGISIKNNTIKINTNIANPGIKSWAKINFLINKLGYTLIKTSENINKSEKDVDESDNSIRFAKSVKVKIHKLK